MKVLTTNSIKTIHSIVTLKNMIWKVGDFLLKNWKFEIGILGDFREVWIGTTVQLHIDLSN